MTPFPLFDTHAAQPTDDNHYYQNNHSFAVGPGSFARSAAAADAYNITGNTVSNPCYSSAHPKQSLTLERFVSDWREDSYLPRLAESDHSDFYSPAREAAGEVHMLNWQQQHHQHRHHHQLQQSYVFTDHANTNAADMDAAKPAAGSDTTCTGFNDHWTWEMPFEIFTPSTSSEHQCLSAQPHPIHPHQDNPWAHPPGRLKDNLHNSLLFPTDPARHESFPRMDSVSTDRDNSYALSHANTESRRVSEDATFQIPRDNGRGNLLQFPRDDSDSDYTPARVRQTRNPQDERYSRRRHTARPKPVKQQSSSSHDLSSSTAQSRKSSNQGGSDGSASALRPFSCPLAPYGCVADFTSKNEWKRHITSQHLCLGFWRCDLCPDVESRPNDFNRKDLFIQHLRRMHSGVKRQAKTTAAKKSKTVDDRRKDPKKKTAKQPDAASIAAMEFEKQIDAIRARCWQQVRDPPIRTSCVFCAQTFVGEGIIEKWLEHLGHHLSALALQHRARPVADRASIQPGYWSAMVDWRRDVELRQWLLREGLLQAQDGSDLYSCADRGTVYVGAGGGDWDSRMHSHMGEEDAEGELE